MSDWIDSMFKLPLEMARVGFDQFEKILDERTRHVDEAGKEFPDPIFQNSGTTVHPNANGDTDNYDHKSDFFQPKVKREDWGSIDLSNMVVIGDSLAAGVDSFSFSSSSQLSCFSAQFASHIGVKFEQVLFEPPGMAFNSNGGISLPSLGQSTVYEQSGLPTATQNFSLPGFSPLDFLALRKNDPWIQPSNPKQTVANLILQRNTANNFERRNLFETALGNDPSFLVFAIGMDYFANHPFSSLSESQKDFVKPLLHMVRVCAEQSFKTIVFNIPNPLDSAAYSDLQTAGRILKVPVSFLESRFGLVNGDHLTVSGIMEIGAQVVGRCTAPLKYSHVVPAERARCLGELVAHTNDFLNEQVERFETVSYINMTPWSQVIENNGTGSERLTADFLGGFYTLNGFTLTDTGQQLLANELIVQLNRQFGGSIPPIANSSTGVAGPSARIQANSVRWSDSFLQQLPSKCDNAIKEEVAEYQKLSDGEIDSKYNAKYRDSPTRPLVLPPNNEQTVDIDQNLSYHGDAMRVINCEPSIGFGSCENNVFDGLALFGGKLSGRLHFRFENPINGISRFEIILLGPMKSFDSSLNTPAFLNFPLLDAKVAQPEGAVCRGLLELESGNVFDLELNLEFQNTGLAVLQNENPQSFPRPAVIKFKSNISPAEQGKVYSTAFAKFVQSDDGLLDFVFHGTAFVPMGPGFRFALPIESPNGSFHTVPAHGTQLHPYIHITTIGRQQQLVSSQSFKHSILPTVIPTNSTTEFVADTSQTCFGDDFQLNHAELGFARGRSRLAGRMSIQFGEQFGDLVPFTCAMLPPGGLLRPKNLSPLQDVFPGKLRPGMEGHDTVLRFPLRTYRQNDLYLIDDPFDIAIGAVNAYTGEVAGDFMHRAFLGQALFYSLVRLEPRTPQGSFQYRGPAFFERLPSGELRFRFNGTVFLPYQKGFNFPLPDGANAVRIGANSSLDPYFQVDAIANSACKFGRKSGGGRMQLSTMEELFSYQFSISNRPNEESSFSYTNHSQNGTFEMTGLIWASFMHGSNNNWRTVTFTGVGKWSLDQSGQSHFASVQFSDRMQKPFVSILIDQGSVSNVNTRPEFETPPLTAL